MKKLYEKVMNETITPGESAELDSLLEACAAMDLLPEEPKRSYLGTCTLANSRGGRCTLPAALRRPALRRRQT
jgi:hypothetical protein